MPIFLEFHKTSGINLKEGQVSIPNTRCLTSWEDKESKRVYNLFDAPNRTTVENFFRKQKIETPSTIYRLNSIFVDFFLGRVREPEFYNTTRREIPGKFRFNLILKTLDCGLLNYKMGKGSCRKLLKRFYEGVKKQIYNFEGLETKSTGDVYIASFVSVYQAMECAVEIRRSSKFAVVPLDLIMVLDIENSSFEDHPDIFKSVPFLFFRAANANITLAPDIIDLYDGSLTAFMEGAPGAQYVKPEEGKLLKLLIGILNQNWQNPKFNNSGFCKFAALSKSGLYRKCTLVTGRSPNSLIREYRLLSSLNLLKTGQDIMKTVYDSGFNSHSYFSRCFKRQFGIPPLSYQKQFTS